MHNVLEPASHTQPATRFNSVTRKLVFLFKARSIEKTRAICPVLIQDKYGSDKMVKVYLCCNF